MKNNRNCNPKIKKEILYKYPLKGVFPHFPIFIIVSICFYENIFFAFEDGKEHQNKKKLFITRKENVFTTILAQFTQ